MSVPGSPSTGWRGRLTGSTRPAGHGATGRSSMLLLYEHPLSSYAQKVKIALREKGMDFKAELPGDFGTGRTDGTFAAINPRVEVPVLTDGPTQIFDSTVIMEYIEERWPEPPLLPREPAARAFARI